MKEGDVVLILDKQSLTNPWTLGIIERVKVSSDQWVRKVVVKYKLNNSKQFKTTEISIHGLSVLISSEDSINPLGALDQIQPLNTMELPRTAVAKLQVKIGQPLHIIKDISRK